MHNKTICIDFDGVIHDYSKGWQGVDVYDKALPGASEGTAALKKEGWTIIIYTTRNDTPALRKFLEDEHITYDYINQNPNQPAGSENGKLIADVYLDDRAVCFRGDWDITVDNIRRFVPWQLDCSIGGCGSPSDPLDANGMPAEPLRKMHE